MEAPFYIFRINTSSRRGWEIRDDQYRPILFIADGLSYLLDSKKMADELCDQLNDLFGSISEKNFSSFSGEIRPAQ